MMQHACANLACHRVHALAYIAVPPQSIVCTRTKQVARSVERVQCIVLERGESLDEFARHVKYEFITVMQARLLRMHFTLP